MATNMKKSLLTYPLILLFFMGALLIGSCKEGPKPGQICITIPKDTSELGRRNHFIPVMDIDIFRKDFQAVRDSVVSRNPNFFIPNSETFNIAAIDSFVQNPKVFGLRFYYGIKPGVGNKKALRLIVVGVDSLGHDIYIKKKGAALAAQVSDDDGGLEYGQCSPPCTVEQP